MEQPYVQNLGNNDQSTGTADWAKNPSSFFAKVMFFFGAALLFSAGGTFVGFHYFSEIFLAHPYLIYVFLAAELILFFAARALSDKRPFNYILFIIYAFVTGLAVSPFIVSVIMQFGGPGIIIKALVATTLTFSAAAIFGWTTHRNLAGLQGFLYIGAMGMLIVSIMGIFIPWSNNFEIVFSGIGVVLFGGFAMYDIQQLKNYPADRYIDAALRLYLDMFNLFLYILRLISGTSRRS